MSDWDNSPDYGDTGGDDGMDDSTAREQGWPESDDGESDD